MGKWIVLSGALLVVAAFSSGDGDPGAGAQPIEPSSTSEEPVPSSSASGALCADVIDASAELAADGSYTFSVTVRSADTGWEKYADAWEIRSPDGAILGTRVLTHPHETEQPFTRSLDSVSVPEGVDTVVIAARDSVEGFCGEQYRLSL
jgi:hypothetical protein